MASSLPALRKNRNPPARNNMGKLNLLLRAFKYRNYRLFFGGQSISLIGTWMQTMAMSWLVYRITSSPFLLGLTGFAGQIPILLFATVTGVAADKFDRRKIMILTQTLSMLQAFALAALVIYGSPGAWQIIMLSFVLGVINAFDLPARQSFVVEIVEKREDMANAIALNASNLCSARIIGPALAGIFIAAFGEGACFLLNAVSYIAVIAALFAMRVSGPASAPERKRGTFREGLSYIAGFPPIKYIMLMLTAASILGMSYGVLLPAYVKDVLHGGPRTLGFIMACSGAGALAAVLRIAMRKTAAGLERGIPVFAALYGLFLLVFSFSRHPVLSAACLFVGSFGVMSFLSSSQTAIQLLVDDDKRGRVMALYSVAFMGMTPIGSLLGGWTAAYIGVAHTIAISGLFMLAGAAAFASRLDLICRHAVPVYTKLGLMQTAAGQLSEAGPG